jgi:hypothetical protein
MLGWHAKKLLMAHDKLLLGDAHLFLEKRQAVADNFAKALAQSVK